MSERQKPTDSQQTCDRFRCEAVAAMTGTAAPRLRAEPRSAAVPAAVPSAVPAAAVPAAAVPAAAVPAAVSAAVAAAAPAPAAVEPAPELPPEGPALPSSQPEKLDAPSSKLSTAMRDWSMPCLRHGAEATPSNLRLQGAMRLRGATASPTHDSRVGRECTLNTCYKFSVATEIFIF